MLKKKANEAVYQYCANVTTNMFTDHEPFDKIIRYSGLTSERVREIGIAGGFIKEQYFQSLF